MRSCVLKIERALYFGIILRTLLEASIDLNFSTLINLRKLQVGSFGDVLSSIFTLIFAIWLIITPALMIVFILRNKRKIQNPPKPRDQSYKDYLSRWSSVWGGDEVNTLCYGAMYI
jgi:hypothetical protein